jgi:hypothetical protein
MFVYEFVRVHIVDAIFREQETETSVGNFMNYLQWQASNCMKLYFNRLSTYRYK